MKKSYIAASLIVHMKKSYIAACEGIRRKPNMAIFIWLAQMNELISSMQKEARLARLHSVQRVHLVCKRAEQDYEDVSATAIAASDKDAHPRIYDGRPGRLCNERKERHVLNR